MSTIWFSDYNLAFINSRKNTLAEHLDINFIEIGNNYLTAKMPVDKTTLQPTGRLHGGASCALLRLSVAPLNMTVDVTKYTCVGLEINANHIRAAREGYVIAKAPPIHIGRSTQVWEIKITDEKTDKLVCISRLTMAVIKSELGKSISLNSHLLSLGSFMDHKLF